MIIVLKKIVAMGYLRLYFFRIPAAIYAFID